MTFQKTSLSLFLTSTLLSLNLMSENISSPPPVAQTISPSTIATQNNTNNTNTTWPSSNITAPSNQTSYAGSAAAPYGAELGAPIYSGSGCRSGSVSQGLAPDGSALSILFSNFIVEADFANNHDRKNCDFSIPIDIPSGYQVRIIRADYRGFNDLPSGAQSRFTVDYFLAGATGNPIEENFYGPQTANYLLQDTVNTQYVTWSDCGQAINFRVNTQLQVWTNGYGDSSLATLDSADITINDPNGPKGYMFHFNWQPCSDNSSASKLGMSGAILSLFVLTALIL